MLQKQLDRVTGYAQIRPTSTIFVVDGITYSVEGSKVPSNNYKPIQQELATSLIEAVQKATNALHQDEATQKEASQQLQEAIQSLTDNFDVVGIQ